MMRRIAALGPLVVAIVGVTACAPPSGGGAIPETETLGLQLIAAWETGNTDFFLDLFDPLVTYDEVSAGIQHQGLAEVLAYLEGLTGWATNVSISVSAVHASETSAAMEWFLTGTQDRPIPGRIRVATDRAFGIPGVTAIEVENHRIVRVREYMDFGALALQLGGSLRLPGDSLTTTEGSG